jgi:3'(2'), 5'-bisphosphate nucleotidase
VSAAPDWPREIEVAADLARRAGAVALAVRDGDLEVEMKAGNEPVTIADKRASELIVAGLGEAFPADVIISEENADDLSRLEAGRVWYIDPIDGTRDFIRGDVGFCIMVGLAIDHRPAFGAVYHPPSGRLFCAAPGTGTWALFDSGDEPSRLEVSGVADLADCRLVASKSHRDQVIDDVKGVLGISNELNIGSVGLKLAIIAAGERDLYVNPSSKCSMWDTCAPAAILAEAGGRLSDVHGEPLRYDTRDIGHRDGLLASNGHLHEAAVARIAPLFGR